MTGTLILLLAAQLGPPVEVRTVDEQTVQGRLAGLDAQAITLATGDEQTTLNIAGILDIVPQRDGAPRETPAFAGTATTLVYLVDGSKIPAATMTVQGDEATLARPDGTAWLLPARLLERVIYPAGARIPFASWSGLLPQNLSADLLVMRREGRINVLEGVLGDVSRDAVIFDVGQKAPVPLERIVATLYYHPAGAAPPTPFCVVHTHDGSAVGVSSARLDGDGRLAMKTTFGADWRAEWSTIERLDFSAGKIVYLSDLEPARASWAPLFAIAAGPSDRRDRWYRPLADRARGGAPIVVQGTTYRKGIALRAGTELVYLLPPGSKRFLATAACDERFSAAADIALTMDGDAGELVKAAVSPGHPQRIDVDVSGVRRLRIRVVQGSRPGLANEILLADAKIVR